MSNLFNVEIEGLDVRDYPEYNKAYIAYAETFDGTPLTTLQLNRLNASGASFRELVQEYYLDQIITKGGD